MVKLWIPGVRGNELTESQVVYENQSQHSCTEKTDSACLYNKHFKEISSLPLNHIQIPLPSSKGLKMHPFWLVMPQYLGMTMLIKTSTELGNWKEIEGTEGFFFFPFKLVNYFIADIERGQRECWPTFFKNNNSSSSTTYWIFMSARHHFNDFSLYVLFNLIPTQLFKMHGCYGLICVPFPNFCAVILTPRTSESNCI